MTETKNKKLRVWYIDRVPCDKSLYVNVKNVKEAILVIDALTRRDLKDERITDNAMGLQVFENGEWCDYYNKDGEDINEIMDREEETKKMEEDKKIELLNDSKDEPAYKEVLEH